MSKGRRTNKGTKEYSDIQRLKHEIDKLKRENSRLKKQIQMLDINRYQDIKELLLKDKEEEFVQTSNKKDIEKLKKEWNCHKCGEGYLKIHILPRLDGVFYYRKCSNKECTNRTNTKKYTQDVKGIKDDES